MSLPSGTLVYWMASGLAIRRAILDAEATEVRFHPRFLVHLYLDAVAFPNGGWQRPDDFLDEFEADFERWGRQDSLERREGMARGATVDGGGVTEGAVAPLAGGAGPGRPADEADLAAIRFAAEAELFEERLARYLLTRADDQELAGAVAAAIWDHADNSQRRRLGIAADSGTVGAVGAQLGVLRRVVESGNTRQRLALLSGLDTEPLATHAAIAGHVATIAGIATSGALVWSSTAGSAYLMTVAAHRMRAVWGLDVDFEILKSLIVGSFRAMAHHTVAESLRGFQLAAAELDLPVPSYVDDWRRYRNLAPATEEELRTFVARDGLFPDEHALGADFTAQPSPYVAPVEAPAAQAPATELSAADGRRPLHDEPLIGLFRPPAPLLSYYGVNPDYQDQEPDVAWFLELGEGFAGGMSGWWDGRLGRLPAVGESIVVAVAPGRADVNRPTAQHSFDVVITGEVPPHQISAAWRVVAVNHESRTMELEGGLNHRFGAGPDERMPVVSNASPLQQMIQRHGYSATLRAPRSVDRVRVGPMSLPARRDLHDYHALAARLVDELDPGVPAANMSRALRELADLLAQRGGFPPLSAVVADPHGSTSAFAFSTWSATVGTAGNDAFGLATEVALLAMRARQFFAVGRLLAGLVRGHPDERGGARDPMRWMMRAFATNAEVVAAALDDPLTESVAPDVWDTVTAMWHDLLGPGSSDWEAAYAELVLAVAGERESPGRSADNSRAVGAIIRAWALNWPGLTLVDTLERRGPLRRWPDQPTGVNAPAGYLVRLDDAYLHLYRADAPTPELSAGPTAPHLRRLVVHTASPSLDDVTADMSAASQLLDRLPDQGRDVALELRGPAVLGEGDISALMRSVVARGRHPLVPIAMIAGRGLNSALVRRAQSLGATLGGAAGGYLILADGAVRRSRHAFGRAGTAEHHRLAPGWVVKLVRPRLVWVHRDIQTLPPHDWDAMPVSSASAWRLVLGDLLDRTVAQRVADLAKLLILDEIGYDTRVVMNHGPLTPPWWWSGQPASGPALSRAAPAVAGGSAPPSELPALELDGPAGDDDRARSASMLARDTPLRVSTAIPAVIPDDRVRVPDVSQRLAAGSRMAHIPGGTVVYWSVDIPAARASALNRFPARPSVPPFAEPRWLDLGPGTTVGHTITSALPSVLADGETVLIELRLRAEATGLYVRDVTLPGSWHIDHFPQYARVTDFFADSTGTRIRFHNRFAAALEVVRIRLRVDEADVWLAPDQFVSTVEDRAEAVARARASLSRRATPWSPAEPRDGEPTASIEDLAAIRYATSARQYEDQLARYLDRREDVQDQLARIVRAIWNRTPDDLRWRLGDVSHPLGTVGTELGALRRVVESGNSRERSAMWWRASKIARELFGDRFGYVAAIDTVVMSAQLQQEAQACGALVDLGPSASTANMLWTAARLQDLGVPGIDLRLALLAIIAAMVPHRFHGVDEVRLGATYFAGRFPGHGLDHPGADSRRRQLRLDPVPEAQLRHEVAIDGKFPHEHMYEFIIDEAVRRWSAIDDWARSRDFFDTYSAVLLEDRARSRLRDLLAARPADAYREVRNAILDLAERGLAGWAYQYLLETDADRRHEQLVLALPDGDLPATTTSSVASLVERLSAVVRLHRAARRHRGRGPQHDRDIVAEHLLRAVVLALQGRPNAALARAATAGPALPAVAAMWSTRINHLANHKPEHRRNLDRMLAHLMAIAIPDESPALRHTPLVGLFSPPPRLVEFYGLNPGRVVGVPTVADVSTFIAADTGSANGLSGWWEGRLGRTPVVGDTIVVAFPPGGFVVAEGLGPDARSAGGFDVVLAGHLPTHLIAEVWAVMAVDESANTVHLVGRANPGFGIGPDGQTEVVATADVARPALLARGLDVTYVDHNLANPPNWFGLARFAPKADVDAYHALATRLVNDLAVDGVVTASTRAQALRALANLLTDRDGVPRFIVEPGANDTDINFELSTWSATIPTGPGDAFDLAADVADVSLRARQFFLVGRLLAGLVRADRDEPDSTEAVAWLGRAFPAPPAVVDAAYADPLTAAAGHANRDIAVRMWDELVESGRVVADPAVVANPGSRGARAVYRARLMGRPSLVFREVLEYLGPLRLWPVDIPAGAVPAGYALHAGRRLWHLYRQGTDVSDRSDVPSTSHVRRLVVHTDQPSFTAVDHDLSAALELLDRLPDRVRRAVAVELRGPAVLRSAEVAALTERLDSAGLSLFIPAEMLSGRSLSSALSARAQSFGAILSGHQARYLIAASGDRPPRRRFAFARAGNRYRLAPGWVAEVLRDGIVWVHGDIPIRPLSWHDFDSAAGDHGDPMDWILLLGGPRHPPVPGWVADLAAMMIVDEMGWHVRIDRRSSEVAASSTSPSTGLARLAQLALRDAPGEFSPAELRRLVALVLTDRPAVTPWRRVADARSALSALAGRLGLADVAALLPLARSLADRALTEESLAGAAAHPSAAAVWPPMGREGADPVAAAEAQPRWPPWRIRSTEQVGPSREDDRARTRRAMAEDSALWVSTAAPEALADSYAANPARRGFAAGARLAYLPRGTVVYWATDIATARASALNGFASPPSAPPFAQPRWQDLGPGTTVGHTVESARQGSPRDRDSAVLRLELHADALGLYVRDGPLPGSWHIDQFPQYTASTDFLAEASGTRIRFHDRFTESLQVTGILPHSDDGAESLWLRPDQFVSIVEARAEAVARADARSRRQAAAAPQPPHPHATNDAATSDASTSDAGTNNAGTDNASADALGSGTRATIEDLAGIVYTQAAQRFEERLATYLDSRPDVQAQLALIVGALWARADDRLRRRLGDPLRGTHTVGSELGILRRVVESGNSRERGAMWWKATKVAFELFGDTIPWNIGLQVADGMDFRRAPHYRTVLATEEPGRALLTFMAHLYAELSNFHSERTEATELNRLRSVAHLARQARLAVGAYRSGISLLRLAAIAVPVLDGAGHVLAAITHLAEHDPDRLTVNAVTLLAQVDRLLADFDHVHRQREFFDPPLAWADETLPPLSAAEWWRVVEGHVPFFQGINVNAQRLVSAHHREGQASGRLVDLGPSSTTLRMLWVAWRLRELGVPGIDLAVARLAVQVYLMPDRLHSYDEVMWGAEFFARQHSLGGLEYPGRDSRLRYRWLPPLTEDELRRHVAVDGRFPDEHMYDFIVDETLRRWTATPGWDESRELFDAYSAVLLEDRARSRLRSLIAAQPHDARLAALDAVLDLAELGLASWAYQYLGGADQQRGAILLRQVTPNQIHLLPVLAELTRGAARLPSEAADVAVIQAISTALDRSASAPAVTEVTRLRRHVSPPARVSWVLRLADFASAFPARKNVLHQLAATVVDCP